MTTTDAMKGKTVIVSGANSGLGKETSVALARMGATVVMLCRSAKRAEPAQQEIVERSGSDDVHLILGDLAAPESLEAFAEKFREEHDRLDVLVNNAGVYMANRYTNEHGWELHWAINHVGTFHLTNLLLPILRESAPARVVTVSSFAHRISRFDLDDPFFERRMFMPMLAYGNSKLANILFAKELARREKNAGITSNALHPGMIATNLSHDDPGLFALGAKIIRPFLVSPADGASTQIYLASSPDVSDVTGKYFASSKERTPSRAARDELLARELWEHTEQLLNGI